MPHDKLIKTLNWVIDFTLKGRIQNKIPINYCGITNSCNSFKYFVFDINSLKYIVILEVATLVLEIDFFNKESVSLWDRTQRHFWLMCLCDCNWTLTLNHLVLKQKNIYNNVFLFCYECKYISTLRKKICY